MKVLIVDDVDANLYLLRVLLSNAGYEVVEAINGQEALDVAENTDVDFVVSDILMPIMDGFEFCKIWKKTEKFKNIPFIFYTATYTEQKDREFALNVGADLFLVKPMESYNLLREIDKVVQKIKLNIPLPTSGKSKLDDSEYYENYSSRLVRKLETKLLQLEQKNIELLQRDASLRQLNDSLQFQLSKVQLTEANLREHEKELLSIVNSMAEGVLTTDDKGIIYEFNPSAEAILGYSRSEVVGKSIEMLMPTYKRESHKNKVNVFAKSERVHIVGRDMLGLNKNGKEVAIKLSVAKLPHTDLKRQMFICTFLDVTMEKKQEKVITRSHKMEAIGALSGGIAHDYNNMLGVIIGYAEILKQNIESEKLTRYLDHINHAADRGVSLTRKLLSFSKKTDDSKEAININEVLNDNADMLRKLLLEKVELKLELTKDIPMISIDRNEFEDTLLNICINAMHAVEDGGYILIKTDSVFMNKNNGKNMPSGNYLQMTIEDNGCGMSEEVRSHVFEPFFTTKGTNGTGLGLSQTYGFIVRSKGHISLESEEGKGTCFTLYFPESIKDKSEHVIAKHSSGDVFTENNLVMVVDDEPVLLNLIKFQIEQLGGKVITAHNGADALDKLSQNKVNLLLSDVIMHGMDGFELVEKVNELYPDVKTLLMSGYNEEENIRHNLQKPFTVNELRTAIVNTL